MPTDPISGEKIPYNEAGKKRYKRRQTLAKLIVKRPRDAESKPVDTGQRRRDLSAVARGMRRYKPGRVHRDSQRQLQDRARTEAKRTQF